jgi:hypothetical protein
MNALLIHFIGFALLGALVPNWVGEVESGFASIWYLCFALVDVIALFIAKRKSFAFVIAVSCAWSAALSLETILLQDLLQSHDYIAQVVIDIAFGVVIVQAIYEWWVARKAQRMVA